MHFHGHDEPSGWPTPRQLPGDVRGFINRAAELVRLDRLLAGGVEDSRVRVLIVAGSPGVGKTSLALHWAHQVRVRFPDGQLYTNLRGYDPGVPVTPEQVLDRFLRTLGVPPARIPADVEDMAGLYRSLLADRRMLLVLDNAATAAQVRPLLPGAPGCFTVVTSRGRLSGLAVRDGAELLKLEVFDEEESVALLRTVTADARGEEDAGELVDLAGLCARLPLALRIAAERAARRPRMQLRELIADLRDESGLWDALSTEDDEEAVRTVFAWSYRALPPDAARMFRLLGLHPGPDLSDHAAAALAGVTLRQARHLLDVLVGAHLVEQTAYDRYELHDLLRAYASGQARQEEPDTNCADTRLRILTWYLHTADEAQGQIEPNDPRLTFDPAAPGVTPLNLARYEEAVRWYEAERVNLVAATHAAADAGLYRIAWQLPVVLRAIYMGRNPFADWFTTSQIGLNAARADDDRAGEAKIEESLGMACTQSHRWDEAEQHHQRALTLRRDLGDTFGQALALNGLGLLARRRRRLDQARGYYEQAGVRFQELGDSYWEALVAGNLASVYLDLNRPSDAHELAQRALIASRDHAERAMEADVLRTLSTIRRESEDPIAALEAARRAVEIARDLGSAVLEGFTLIELGHAERAIGQPGEALVSYQRAASLHRRVGDRSREAEAWDGAGLAYQALDRHGEAADFHQQAASVYRALDDPWHLALTLDHLAAALNAVGAIDEARAHRREALDLLAVYDDPKAVRLHERIAAALDT